MDQKEFMMVLSDVFSIRGFFEFSYLGHHFSIQKIKKRFQEEHYILIDSNGNCQSFNSLEELMETGQLRDVPLKDACQMINLDLKDDLSYEAINHTLVVYGGEILFKYHNMEYWIAHYKDVFHLSDENEKGQVFSSAKELLEKSLVEGKHLQEIWNEVEIISVS